MEGALQVQRAKEPYIGDVMIRYQDRSLLGSYAFESMSYRSRACTIGRHFVTSTSHRIQILNV